MPRSLPTFDTGDIVTAENLNRLLDAVMELESEVGGGVHTTPRGRWRKRSFPPEDIPKLVQNGVSTVAEWGEIICDHPAFPPVRIAPALSRNAIATAEKEAPAVSGKAWCVWYAFNYTEEYVGIKGKSCGKSTSQIAYSTANPHPFVRVMGNEEEQDASLVPIAKWYERNRPSLLTANKADEDALRHTTLTHNPNAASPWHAPAYCGLYKGNDGAQYFLYTGQLADFSTVLHPSAGTPQPLTNCLAAHLDRYGFLTFVCNYLGNSSS